MVNILLKVMYGLICKMGKGFEVGKEVDNGLDKVGRGKEVMLEVGGEGKVVGRDVVGIRKMVGKWVGEGFEMGVG